MEILFILIVFCYLFLQFIEFFAFGSRIAGMMSSFLAFGTTLHQTIYTASRFLLVPMLPSLGFVVEHGIERFEYYILVSSSLLLVLISCYWSYIKIDSIQCYFQRLFHLNKSGNIVKTFFSSIFTEYNLRPKIERVNFGEVSIDLKTLVVSSIAYFFLVSGFFFAFFFAIIYPEYRLTLSQLTAAFHGIGAVIFAFYLDPMLSSEMDLRKTKWKSRAKSIMIGRLISYIVSFLFFTYTFYIF